ncbi:MAG TPA: cache domain-containing protein, partial [Methylophilaceae bacterium]|nr:cache domain-containing protein [Methylophilaceae bacterium]
MGKVTSIREKFLRSRKFQTSIIVAFAVLLFVVMLAALVIIDGILSNSANKEIQKNLDTGNQLFNFLDEEYSQRLIQTASILSSDFAFRKAIATADHETIVSALANHGARFNANVMFLADTDHHMIADTLGLTQPNRPFPFPELLASAEREGKATSIVLLDDRLYQMVLVPVLAPAPIAWLASGFIIDSQYAHNLQALTGLEVSFLARQQATGQWRVLATTLP